MEFATKNRQIQILEDRLLRSPFVNQNMIDQSKALYFDNPYHNYLHALRVANYVLDLPINKFTPIEICSLVVAGLFHDAGHTGKAQTLDEFESLAHYRDTMDLFHKDNPDFMIDDGICRSSIIGTVFKNRATNQNRYARIMADLDIGDIGAGIADFLYYGSLLALEFHQNPTDYYTKAEKGYFQYLMGIEPYIFRSEEVREAFPYALKTIMDFYTIPLDTKLQMFETLLKEDVTLDEFKERFF